MKHNVFETKRKVKLFTGPARDVESSINSFIEDKHVVDMKFTSVCYPTQYKNSVATKMDINDRVLVIYDELEETDE